MSIEAINAIMTPVLDLSASHDATSNQVTHGIADWVWQQIISVDENLHRADQLAQAAASGESATLHDVMIGIEEARLSFLLLTQIRNRALEATQEIFRMQI